MYPGEESTAEQGPERGQLRVPATRLRSQTRPLPWQRHPTQIPYVPHARNDRTGKWYLHPMTPIAVHIRRFADTAKLECSADRSADPLSSPRCLTAWVSADGHAL
jgi:hypothetical protein